MSDSTIICDRRTHSIIMDLAKARQRGLVDECVDFTHCHGGPAAIRADFGNAEHQLEIVYPVSAVRGLIQKPIYCQTTLVNSVGEKVCAPHLGYSDSRQMANLYELTNEINRLHTSWKHFTI